MMLGKGQQPYKPNDFMISLYKEPEKELTPEEAERLLVGIFGA